MPKIKVFFTETFVIRGEGVAIPPARWHLCFRRLVSGFCRFVGRSELFEPIGSGEHLSVASLASELQQLRNAIGRKEGNLNDFLPARPSGSQVAASGSGCVVRIPVGI